MKCNAAHMILLLTGMLMIALAGCSDGDGKKENPFGPGDGDFIKVTPSSNADTLHLLWEITDAALKFDGFKVEVANPSSVKALGKDATGCFFTHIPYDELVPVTVSLTNGNEEVGSYSAKFRIDGLDHVTSAVIIPDQGSVTGGDGMYSILLPDGRSIFLMGDSYTGQVSKNQRSNSDRMFRNTYILYDEGKVSGISGFGGDRNASAAVPPGYPHEDKWYWPGHGFVNGDKLYIFQTLMYTGAEGMWGFTYETTHILEYQLPGMELLRTERIPFNGSQDVHYGMAVLCEGGYIYIYAQVDVTNDANPISEVLVARTTIDDLYTKWEYYNGKEWSPASGSASKLEGLASVPVSSQFNVFKLRDKYVLLTQKKTFNSGEIYTFTSDTPYGPWRNKQLIFKTYEQDIANLFTYNAMAHPQFEKDGMILISYNVNTEVYAQQFSDVTTYRPRFFWYGIDKILNN